MSKFDPKHHPVEPARNKRAVTGPARTLIIFLQKSIWILSKRWLLLANFISGAILLLGFLAPASMSIGLPEAGQTAYDLLAPHNHQLPQRSYFLFGQAGGLHSYSLQELLAFGAAPDNLQAFVGNPEIGFKMALNHRMTAIFIALFLGGVGWGLAGGRPRLGPLWFILLLLPLLIDGFSHMISEHSGQGFRESNVWAAELTGNVFSPAFYEGATIGSLNWLLRTLTGVLFGLGFVWFLYTYLAIRFKAIQLQLTLKLKKIGAIRDRVESKDNVTDLSSPF